ncbi:MAG: energy-coupling factor ABC transporter permease [Chloroflexota bacterium]|nr:energy-coupling factor ABC transporter permease [Chloroflexota bacterium]
MCLSNAFPHLWEVVGPVVDHLHIPDGFLSLPISFVFWLLTALLVSLAARSVSDVLGERQVPLVGVLAAGIFAVQMLNFPVAGGTSGHMLGGALAAIVLGPWAGILAMAAVIAVQAMVFQDGGLVVMGANIFDMGILTALVGYGIYRMVAGQRKGVRLMVAGFAAWFSVMAAALAVALQIWLSGNADAALLFPAMLGVHALVGIGEALLTVGALAFIESARPDLLLEETVRERGSMVWVPAGLAAAFAVTLLAPFASSDPDGLERVATNLGFLGQGQGAPYEVLPDYTIPFLGETALSTILSGVIGMLVVFGLLYALVGALRKPGAAGAEH